MIMRVISLIGILPVFMLQLYGIGHAESGITMVFKYEFPVAQKRLYKSHTVTFAHSKHAMEFKITCVQCHHTLEPGATAVEKTCIDCHGSKALRDQRNHRAPGEKGIPPYLIALHGMCIDCHKEIKEHNPDLRVPLACWRCHIREKN